MRCNTSDNDGIYVLQMVVNLENELAKVLEELVEEKEHILRLEESEKAIQRSYKVSSDVYQRN